MHEYLYEADVVRIGVIAGIVVSTLLYERLHVTTGGAIVPGYLGLFLLAPTAVFVTVLAGYLTYRFVNGPLAGRLILYGRRKFEVEVLIGLGLVGALYWITTQLGDRSTLAGGVFGIGFVLPGLIAHDMSRQGARTTWAVLIGATLLVAIVVELFVVASAVWPPVVIPPASPAAPRSFDISLLLPAVMTSVLAGLLIYRTVGIRSGGFVTAAYLAMVAAEPRDVIFTIVIGLVTYVLVARVLLRPLLLFGRRKVAMMLLVGASIAWVAQLAIGAVTAQQYVPWAGFNAITLVLPGLVGNDMQRQGIERTGWGIALSSLAVLAAIRVLAYVTAAHP